VGDAVNAPTLPAYDRAAVLRVLETALTEVTTAHQRDGSRLSLAEEDDAKHTARVLADVLERAVARVRATLDPDDESYGRNIASLTAAAAELAEVVTVDVSRLTPLQRAGAACGRCDRYLVGAVRTLGPPLHWHGQPVQLLACSPHCRPQPPRPLS
jgi:hypothetical protein